MNRETLLRLVEADYGIAPDYPWADLPEAAVLRHPGNRKWFALLMPVPVNRFDPAAPDPRRTADLLNLKCDPLALGSAQMLPGFYPAYHMNKAHWISVDIERADRQNVLFFLSESFRLTAPRPRRKKAGNAPPHREEDTP